MNESVMAVTRRELLKRTAKTVATAAGMGAGLAGGHFLLRKQVGQYPVDPVAYGAEGVRLIRPPGAVEEAELLAGCVRCYICQDACEPGAIQFFDEADGELYHTPYVDPAIKACTRCRKCTQGCPTGGLKPMDVDQRADARMGSVELRTDLCLSYKAKAIRYEQGLLTQLGKPATESEATLERRGPCGECYMFCLLREDAIKLEPGAFLSPMIFPDACVGCGLCEEICRQMVRGEPAIRVVPTRQRM